MKLLLDENLSRRMVPALQLAFPGSSQVVLTGLQSASDAEVWDYAKANGFVLVSKDDDFVALSGLRGHPPRLIKLSLGNCRNQQVIDALLGQQALIEGAFADQSVSMVEVIPPVA